MSLTKTPTSMIDTTGATAGNVITFNGSTATWVASAAQAGGALGASSLAANGYVTLSNGIIIQWGTGSGNYATNTAVTFAVSFPSACWSVTSSVMPSDGTTTSFTFGTNTPTLGGFNWNWNRTGGSAGSATLRWMAIGY